ncbi:MAG TPA: terminase [Methylococcaceae bacterium]|nr:terminase [Methylococcaceae bacterium]
MQVNLKVTEPQSRFLNLDCKFPAFVAGFGTGKSEVMCTSALLDSLEGGSNSLIAMYEPTYDLVRLILAPRMEEKLIDWGIRYKYNKSENIIYTSSGQVGDFVFRTLDNPARIVGYESFRAKIDELDTLKPDHAQEAFNKIIARNRQVPDTYQRQSDKPMNTVSVFTTPEGFKFVYNKWSKNRAPGYEIVQAATMSNPFLPEDYVQALKDSYPPQLIEAYLNGEFVNLTSGSVYTCYDRKKNNSRRVINDNDHLHIGMDFNVGKMSAVVHVKDGRETTAVDEFMGLLDTPAMIQAIQTRYPDHRVTIYPDSSGKNRKSANASETDVSQLREAFRVVVSGRNPFVKDRIASVQAMLCNANGERKYFVNETKCPETAESLEQQVYNKQGEPDKSHDNDHPNDALGYYIHSQYPIIKNISHSQQMIV